MSGAALHPQTLMDKAFYQKGEGGEDGENYMKSGIFENRHCTYHQQTL
ncbi:hypothetical protein [Bacteroides sp.]